jgi:polar amino acid transport system ATP-binding protein
MHPQVLLLDEVTSALDPLLVGEVLAVIAELTDSGMTVVMATHEMSFARDVADQVVFLDAGVVVEEGSAARVLDSPEHPRTAQFLERFRDR